MYIYMRHDVHTCSTVILTLYLIIVYITWVQCPLCIILFVYIYLVIAQCICVLIHFLSRLHNHSNLKVPLSDLDGVLVYIVCYSLGTDIELHLSVISCLLLAVLLWNQLSYSYCRSFIIASSWCNK